jgi:hypothetical protein
VTTGGVTTGNVTASGGVSTTNVTQAGGSTNGGGNVTVAGGSTNGTGNAANGGDKNPPNHAAHLGVSRALGLGSLLLGGFALAF